MVVDVGAGLALPLLLAISSCSAISAAGERSLVTGKTTAAAVVGVFHRRCRLRWLTESLPESLWLLRKRFGAEVLVAGILIVDFGSRRKGLGDAFELWNCVLSNSQKPSTENPFEDDVLTPYIFPLSGYGRRRQRFGKKLVHDKCPPTFKSNRACGRVFDGTVAQSPPSSIISPAPLTASFLSSSTFLTHLFLAASLIVHRRLAAWVHRHLCSSFVVSVPLLCSSAILDLNIFFNRIYPKSDHGSDPTPPLDFVSVSLNFIFSVHPAGVAKLYDRLGFNLLRFFDPISALNMAISEPTAGEFFPEKKNVRNPLVPVGAFITAGVLTAGLISFRRGNSHLGQKLMRARVVVQGATVALMVGTAYYYGDNPWQSDHKKEKI
ncbi:hypothetical protein Ahy_B02g060511 isoform A [Arachis hypogaea]|uniref:HIG1 domain-containing protein n=2 Tax=Arachis TaxID=3817 RepID=A0A445AIN0_ARAHY|nr:hypothetical protein Ahy_B02g060511 isoform A [Arachis hypogaea]